MDQAPLSPPVGASVWELQMFEHLTGHTRREGVVLGEYAQIAATTESKALKYVIDMLLDDERRHHRYFNDLAASLKSEAELAREDPVVPRLDFDRVGREELRETTDRLLDNERDDLKELQRLRKELHELKDTTLWRLLVDIMIHDTEKHIDILRFVEHHAPSKRSSR